MFSIVPYGLKKIYVAGFVLRTEYINWTDTNRGNVAEFLEGVREFFVMPIGQEA